MKDLQTARKRLFLALFLLLLALVCAAVGIATAAKYVREEKSTSLTVAVEYKKNYLVPREHMSTGLTTSPATIVFTTLDDLSAKHSVTYDNLTNQKNMGYEVISDGTNVIDTIKFGYDESTDTGYFISMTNRPIVPYDGNSLFYGNYQKTTAIDFGGTVTVGGVEVPLFDTSGVTNMHSMFHGCSSLTSLDLSNFDTSKVRDMLSMFNSCSSLASLDLSTFDTSNVTTMESMFYKCSKLASLDISNFDTSNVTTMAYMFSGCSSLSALDISNFETPNVTKMTYMFSDCSALTSLDVSNFDTSNVTTMSYMFDDCSALASLDVSKFVTSKVTEMACMFYNCKALTSLNVSSFDTSQVTSFGSMFSGCTRLSSINVSNFDTSNATSMTGMFSNCSSLTSLNVSNFDTSNVTTMYQMFYMCSRLTSLDLSAFDVSKVTSTEGMFYSCTSLKTIYASYDWPTATITKSNNMFSSCSTLVGGKGSSYKTYLNNPQDNKYALIDGGTDKPGYFTVVTLNPTALQTKLTEGIDHIVFGKTSNHADVIANASSVTPFALAGTASSRGILGYTVTANDETTLYVLTPFAPMVAPESCRSPFTLSQEGDSDYLPVKTITFERENLEDSTSTAWFDTSNVTDMVGMFQDDMDNPTLEAINGLDTFDTSKVTNMNYMFYGLALAPELDLSSFDTSNVISMQRMFNGYAYDDRLGQNPASHTLDLSYFDTSNVQDMSNMFDGCLYLTSLDLSGWDVSSVTTMTYMFSDCSALTSLDLSGWDVSSVTTMSYMFNGCISLTSLDLSTFDTSNVTAMDDMFYKCSKLASLDVSNFVTSKVTTMVGMFNACSVLTSLDVSNFDTSNVTSMNYTFYNCSSLTELDLSGWNTANVTNMDSMFRGCTSLTTIYVGDSWSTESVTNSSLMFSGCTKLVGGAGTAYDSAHIDGAYAHIDGGTANPGYLTSDRQIDAAALKAAYADVSHLVFGKADEHSDVIADATAILLSVTGGSTVAGYKGTDANGEVTLYVLSQTNPIIAPDCKELFYNATNIKTITFESATDAAGTAVAWFDTSAVSDMSYMFATRWDSTGALTAINGLTTLNTAQVTNMSYMFSYAKKLTSLDLSSFNTANVTEMAYMFNQAAALTEITGLNTNTFKTSSVTTMAGMFYYCGALTSLELSKFDTTKVTDMFAMFSGCSSLTSLDVSSFNASQVTKMQDMFSYMTSLTEIIGLEGFNTTAVLTSMDYMFQFCSKITQLDLSSFDVSGVTGFYNVFNGCKSLQTILVNESWSLSSLSSAKNCFGDNSALVGGAGTKYDSTHVSSTYAVIDGLNGQKGYLTLVSTMSTAGVRALLEENSDAITNVVFSSTAAYPNVVTGAEANPVSFAGNAVNYYLVGDTAYVLSKTPIKVYYDASNLFKELTNIQTIKFESVDGTAWFDTSRVTNMSGMFEAKQDGETFYSSLTAIKGLDTFDTSNVTNMMNMFRHCQELTGTLDLSAWDTSNVTTMEAMFDGLHAISEIKFGTGFDTSKVTSMKHMFNECKNLSVSLDLSMFDTSNVTNMYAMFNRCNKLPSINFGENFNTEKVTDMQFMFAGNHKLASLDLHTFNTANVTNMWNMFNDCNTLTSLDLSAFNTANVTNMANMFYNCSALTTIIVGSGWNTDSVTSSADMFNSCSNLVGGAGTMYNPDHLDKAYAHIDENGNPGYLTAAATMSTAAVRALLEENSDAITNVVFGSTAVHLTVVAGATANPVSFAGNAVNYYLVGNTAYILSDDPILVYYDASNLFKELTNIQTITFESVDGIAWFDTSRVTNMSGMFEAKETTVNGTTVFETSLTTITGLETFDTSNVTNMARLFRHCEALGGVCSTSRLGIPRM